MARLRDEVDRNPALAIEIAREAERRYPQGRYADERAFLEMRALVHLNRISAARERAEEFFGRHRTSPFAERVHRLTGVHPRPRLPR